jgi:peptide/nickel transport system permease protein
VVESIFAWPGLGLYTVHAIASFDFPAVAGVTLVMGAAYVIINALVDLAQVAADPRLRAR